MSTTKTETKPETKQLAPIDHKTILKVNDFRAMLTGESMMKQLAAALPGHLKTAGPRYARCVLTEFQKNWQLTKCTAMSIFGCMIQAAQLGLEIGGPLGQAYMVPYGNKKLGMDPDDPKYPRKEAVFQIGYRGLAQLAHRSGMVKAAYAHIVCVNDQFDIALGTEPRVLHKPARTDRGAIIGAYAVVQYTNGGCDFEYMTKNEIEKHRDRYSKAAGKDDSPWKTAPEEMMKKTPFRRLMKRVPMATELQAAAMLDEYGEAGVGQQLHTLVNAEGLVAGPSTGAGSKAEALDLDLPEPEMDFGDGYEPPEENAEKPADEPPPAENPPQTDPPADDEPAPPTATPKKGGMFADAEPSPTTDGARNPDGKRKK